MIIVIIAMGILYMELWDHCYPDVNRQLLLNISGNWWLKCESSLQYKCNSILSNQITNKNKSNAIKFKWLNNPNKISIANYKQNTSESVSAKASDKYHYQIVRILTAVPSTYTYCLAAQPNYIILFSSELKLPWTKTSLWCIHFISK